MPTRENAYNTWDTVMSIVGWVAYSVWRSLCMTDLLGKNWYLAEGDEMKPVGRGMNKVGDAMSLVALGLTLGLGAIAASLTIQRSKWHYYLT